MQKITFEEIARGNNMTKRYFKSIKGWRDGLDLADILAGKNGRYLGYDNRYSIENGSIYLPYFIFRFDPTIETYKKAIKKGFDLKYRGGRHYSFYGVEALNCAWISKKLDVFKFLLENGAKSPAFGEEDLVKLTKGLGVNNA